MQHGVSGVGVASFFSPDILVISGGDLGSEGCYKRCTYPVFSIQHLVAKEGKKFVDKADGRLGRGRVKPSLFSSLLCWRHLSIKSVITRHELVIFEVDSSSDKSVPAVK